MKLLNIANKDRFIYLFSRDDKGVQTISRDNNFYPFFFEPDKDGTHVSYDGKLLKKIIVSKPSDISNMRSDKSYSSDIRYINNYLTHSVDKIEKCPIKYVFLDIEILAKELPDLNNPILPVSCVTIYNSFNKEYRTFFLNDYTGTIESQEKSLFNSLITYFKKEMPDLWLSWHVDFDYLYLHNRYRAIYNKSFAKAISPIDTVRARRASKEDVVKDGNVFYPAGIAILDYLTMFKKVNMRESSYKLDSVAEKYLGVGKKHKEVDFSKVTEILKLRNIEDVELLVKLEERFKIIEYFNEIRLFSKAVWEDLTHNSMIIDSIIMNEAKRREIVLPNKPVWGETEEAEELIGAYRRSEAGVFFDVYKADVASMYPQQLVNFCLDTSNIVNDDTTHENVVCVNGVRFLQDKEAILPYLAIQLMGIKNTLKRELKETKIDSEESKILQMKYDAYKGLVNSLFGVTAFASFRLYDNRVASAITFLARELLHYSEDEMQKAGHKVIAVDTDALIYESKKDEIDFLNQLVQKWAKERYGKDFVDIEFEAEGIFRKLLIIGKCHYFGYIESKKGIKKEIKGIEVKRSSSSKYESYFQENLIEKILNKEDKVNILKWIESEKQRIKTLPLNEVAFPSKISNKKYKNMPIFVRALNNTKKLIAGFTVLVAETYYYVFVKSYGIDINGKEINVLAFTTEQKDFIDKNRIDWQELTRRNIDMKVDALFEAIGWTTQSTLF